MFPYPSGAGLHVGHPLGYIGTDVYARYWRMQGCNVLHAMGYDAFGLPAEQYAVQTGQHPRVTTEANIANMRRQLRALGLGHDPRRGVATTDVPYYRWTQWIFLQIFNSWYDEVADRARPIAELIAEFESGSRAPSSPANPDGRPWAELDDPHAARGRRLVSPRVPRRGNGELVSRARHRARERRSHRRRSQRPWQPPGVQASAQAVGARDHCRTPIGSSPISISLDWPEPIKIMQRNWIGRSGGANVAFPVFGHDDVEIEVFTTRPDTLFGATYMVLAPEHPLVDHIVPNEWPDALFSDELTDVPPAWRGIFGTDEYPAEAVRKYREFAAVKSDLERQSEGKVKTGVFTGAFAINPVNGAHIPIFIADYVMMGYGTGAIMAVPAHDERDFEFAREFDLPIVASGAPVRRLAGRARRHRDAPARRLARGVRRRRRGDERRPTTASASTGSTTPDGQARNRRVARSARAR